MWAVLSYGPSQSGLGASAWFSYDGIMQHNGRGSNIGLQHFGRVQARPEVHLHRYKGCKLENVHTTTQTRKDGTVG